MTPRASDLLFMNSFHTGELTSATASHNGLPLATVEGDPEGRFRRKEVMHDPAGNVLPRAIPEVLAWLYTLFRAARLVRFQ